jgi:modulator of FtsH protease
VIGDHLGPLLLIAGGISLVVGDGGGLYWVVPGLVAAMIAAIVGAWVMLVEIVR